MMIPITAEYNNFEVINVVESLGCPLYMHLIIKVGNQIGRGQFLSDWVEIEKGKNIKLSNNSEELGIIFKVIKNIKMKPGDDLIYESHFLDWSKFNKDIPDKCIAKILWNVNIKHEVLSWDKSSSSTPGKKTFTVSVHILDIIIKDNDDKDNDDKDDDIDIIIKI